MKKSNLIFILILVFNFVLISNAAELKGTVYGIDGESKKVKLSKASVFCLGTTIGTIADNDGSFKIERSFAADKLVIRYVGYKTDTISVENEIKEIAIVLKSGYTSVVYVLTASLEQ